MYFAQHLIGCRGVKGKFLKKKNIKTIFFTEPIRGMKLKLGIHAQDISLYENCVYCSSRMRIRVVMTTYSLHRLIMGTLKNNIFSCLNGDICNLYLQERFIE